MLGVILAVRILKREKCEGLFAKLNSGATNSVGGTSKRSDVEKEALPGDWVPVKELCEENQCTVWNSEIVLDMCYTFP